MKGWIYLPRRTRRTHALAPLSSKAFAKNPAGDYLDYPNEGFQLVDVKLQVHAVRQPGADDIHRAGVPLLQERQDFSSNHVTCAHRALHTPACGGTKLPPGNGTWQASGGRPAPSFMQNFHARASNFSQRQQSYSEGSRPPAAPPGFCNPVLPLTWLGSRGGSFGLVQLLTRSPPQWEHSPAFSTTLELLTGLKSNATGHGESLLRGKGWLRVRMRRREHPRALHCAGNALVSTSQLGKDGKAASEWARCKLPNSQGPSRG